MKFISLCIVLISICFAYGHDGAKGCTYEATDGRTNYDFSALRGNGSGLVYKDLRNNTWHFIICGGKRWNPVQFGCAADTGVCLVPKTGMPVNAGKFSTALWSDSPNGVASGVEITMGDGDNCVNGGKRKTNIELVCDYGVKFVVSALSMDGCFQSLRIRTSSACPLSETMDGEGHEDEDDHHGNPLVFFIITLVGIFCCCLCVGVCCQRNRRRMQRRKQECEMVQFSNVAFQPLAQEPPKEFIPRPQQVQQQSQRLPFPVPVQQLPTYYPTVQQMQPVPFAQPPQYFIYPQQPIQYQPSPIVQPVAPVIKREEQVGSDEQLARQLQAQFDKE